MKLTIALLFVVILGTHGTAYGLDGRINNGEYVSSDKLFRVPVPVMRNPFIKKPSVISDERRSDGGVEVNFSVMDLGEAWRFGARPLAIELSTEKMALTEICDAELKRWVQATSNGDIVLEENIQREEGPAIARIYYVESATLLFVKHGEGPAKRESALIGVIAILVQQEKRVLYVVGQFDMPNRGGHYTLETERGRKKLAEEHLRRLRELSSSLKPQ